ncbi:MAG: hypothetical protein R3A46_03655 [Thermomicrobiales bacterium]
MVIDRIERIRTAAYTVPTDEPESDGTLTWDSTTIVVVRVDAGGTTGLGYAYTDAVAARLIDQNLAPLVLGRNPLDVPGSWNAMVHSIRNIGRPGIASSAISAVDIALWDLKARLLDLPSRACLVKRANPFRSTAVAGSHPTRWTRSGSSSEPGPMRGCPGSR